MGEEVKKYKSDLIIIMILIAAFIVFLVLQLLLFHDVRDMAFYLIQDLIFLPLNILFVTFALNRILQNRQKKDRLEHVNILISAFFSDVGMCAIGALNPYIQQLSQMQELLYMDERWDDKAFKNAADAVKSHALSADLQPDSIQKLQTALIPSKPYLLSMFSNANLLEHDTFTDMLWAFYHLIDELENREDMSALPNADLLHLSGDMIRSYALIVYEWVFYMQYLKKKYPYLWSLAIRKNPFADNEIVLS